MPTYCYRREDNDKIERVTMSIDERGRLQKERVVDGEKQQYIKLDDGVIGIRDYVVEQGRFQDTPANWPQYSDAMGCHPDQVVEAAEGAAKAGVPTDFTSDGQAIFESAGHRKAYCEAYGYYDRNGGYSDPAPKNRTSIKEKFKSSGSTMQPGMFEGV